MSFSILVMNWGFPALPRVLPLREVAWDLCLVRQEPAPRASEKPEGVGPAPYASRPNWGHQGAMLTICCVTLGHLLLSLGRVKPLSPRKGLKLEARAEDA